jgi:hypothetical protein
MSISELIKNNPLKAKELTELIAQNLIEKKFNIIEVLEEMPKLNQSNRGNCMEAITIACTKHIELFDAKWLAALLPFLGNEPARVKWECARTISEIAKQIQADWSKHITLLLVNAQKDGTVVRWSSAHALVQLYLENPKVYAHLKIELESLQRNEEKNSIQKIYARALKQ